MRNGRRRSGLFGLARLAPVMVGGFVAALMIGGAATGALLTSSEGSDTEPPSSISESASAGEGGAVALLAADLTLAKTAPPTVGPGGTIPYVITVTNGGDEAATNVQVTDELPDAAEFESLDDPGEYCSREAQFIDCTIPSLEAGTSAEWTINTTATEIKTIENTAFLQRPDQEPLAATASTQVTVDPRISIVKSAPESATVGEEFPYTLHVHNGGNVNLIDMRVVDELPDGVEFVEFVGASGDACDEVSGVVTCLGDSLSPCDHLRAHIPRARPLDRSRSSTARRSR